MHENEPNVEGLLTPQQQADRVRWASEPEADARREAQKPSTTGTRLEVIAREMRQLGTGNVFTTPPGQRPFGERRGIAEWVLEAVFAHPNVPPAVVQSFFEYNFFSDAMARAFFTNPAAAFTLLEMPNFLTALPVSIQNHLLKQETIPPVMVRSLAALPPNKKGSAESVAATARLHIAVAGEADTENWESELRAYWQSFCDRATGRARRWHVDLVEQGLAPEWAARPLPPPEKLTRQKVLAKWFAFAHAPNSDETRALARRIAPYLEPEFVVHHLRAEATESDLANLLAAADHKKGLVGRAILRHPSVSEELIRRLVRADEGRFRHDAVCLPQTPPDVIGAFSQSPVPEIRRAARVHPNAPADAKERSWNATRKHLKGETRNNHCEFLSFVWFLNQGQKTPNRYELESEEWTKRLEQVFLVTPENMDKAIEYDRRTPSDLLRLLRRDGNRFVRAAARAKTADPNYRFVL